MYRMSILVAVILGCCLTAEANVFYVNTQGNDAWPGTQTQPWQSIGKVNAQALHAGDQVLFAGGQTFVGSLYVAPEESGTAANPILFSSYGIGPAWISSGVSSGLFGYNTSHVRVSNLNFIGNGAVLTSGVAFYTDTTSGAKGITLTSLDVSGYGRNGIEVGSWGTHAGFRSTDVESSVVHFNGEGVVFYAQYPDTHQDVFLQFGVAAHNMRAGIVLGSVARGTVQFTQAYENGIGILVYDATQVVLHNNVAHHNRLAGGTGAGMAFDQNVTFSTMQFGETHENEGPGYELSAATPGQSDNVLQYNTSTNDSRNSIAGGIQLWGYVRNAVVRDNTVSMTAGAINPTAAIMLANWGLPTVCPEEVLIRGNVFQATSHVVVALSTIVTCPAFQFYENTYEGDPFSIFWGLTQYVSLEKWTAETGMY